MSGIISSILQTRKPRLREFKLGCKEEPELEWGPRSSCGSWAPSCHAALGGTAERFLCPHRCCFCLLQKQARNPLTQESWASAPWLPLGVHPADRGLGRQAICLKEVKLPAWPLSPSVPTGGSLPAAITASEETAGARAQCPAHHLWGIG